jgi:hypothetical protein
MRRIRWVGRVASTAEKRCTYRVLVGRCEGKRPLVRPRRRWEDNVKWIFKKWDGGMDWIDLA